MTAVRTCSYVVPAGSVRVDVDLGGAARPAGLGDVDRAGAGCGTAVAEDFGAVAVLLDAGVASTLPALTANHWEPKPWSDVATTVGVAAHQVLGELQGRVGLRIRIADVAVGHSGVISLP